VRSRMSASVSAGIARAVVMALGAATVANVRQLRGGFVHALARMM
jgi:hypothetical protein